MILVENLKPGDKIKIYGWLDGKNTTKEDKVVRKATVESVGKRFITVRFDKGYRESWPPDKLGLAINNRPFDGKSLVDYKVLKDVNGQGEDDVWDWSGL